MKSKIIEEMRRRHDGDLSQVAAGRTLDLVVDSIQAVINRDKEARLPGFGTFKKKFREGREGRNPATGATVSIPGRDVVTFKAAKG